MTKYYRDYIWKNGLPYGINPYLDESHKNDTSYKISSDPYHKRMSIEKYQKGLFSSVIYDSALFDFRHLKQGEKLAWQKTSINETETTAVCHIRNQDDRLILIEEYRFENGLCRECQAFTSLGNLLSMQKIYYTDLGDAYNGVMLFDSNEHQVMSKHYTFDEETKQFSELIKEDWTL